MWNIPGPLLWVWGIVQHGDGVFRVPCRWTPSLNIEGFFWKAGNNNRPSSRIFTLLALPFLTLSTHQRKYTNVFTSGNILSIPARGALEYVSEVMNLCTKDSILYVIDAKGSPRIWPKSRPGKCKVMLEQALSYWSVDVRWVIYPFE